MQLWQQAIGLRLTVNGKQSHGSQPWSGIDPIVVATQIIQGFQTIVSRQENINQSTGCNNRW